MGICTKILLVLSVLLWAATLAGADQLGNSLDCPSESDYTNADTHIGYIRTLFGYDVGNSGYIRKHPYRLWWDFCDEQSGCVRQYAGQVGNGSVDRRFFWEGGK